MSYIILAKGDRKTYLIIDAILCNGLFFIFNIIGYSIYSVNYLPKLDVCSGEYKYKLQNWPTELSEFLILKPYVKLGAIDTKEYLKKMSGEYLEYNSSDKIITIKQFIYVSYSFTNFFYTNMLAYELLIKIDTMIR